MQTSLLGIANKSAKEKTYRFRNLFGMLTVVFLHQCWKLMNKKSAKGVDNVSAKEYEENLHSNITGLVARVKSLSYRARLILRCFIPKIGGKLRPLGMPVTEDKLLQKGVSKILEAIFESAFLSCSFGYRPKLGAHDAIKDVSYNLFRGYNFIVEADIRGFFDNINHEWLMKMLEHRIDDKPFLNLIQKWLKAGILLEGKVINPATGTPQGGVISSILANIYLHYVLDIWFEKVVKQQMFGKAYLCRFADDFICAFQSKRDAELFFKMLRERMAKFGLELAEEKTRILRFSRLYKEDKASFDFLGFEFRWETTKTGRNKLAKRTSRQKLRNSLIKFREWCKENRNRQVRDLIPKLNTKLRGYYNYYGIIGNSKSLSEFFYHAINILFKWLNRRSQRKSYDWSQFNQMLKYYQILKPRITERQKVQLCLPF